MNVVDAHPRTILEHPGTTQGKSACTIARKIQSERGRERARKRARERKRDRERVCVCDAIEHVVICMQPKAINLCRQ